MTYPKSKRSKSRKNSQVLWVGTKAGLHDKGKVRVKSFSGTTTSGTLTVAKNSIAWDVGDFVTLKHK